MQVDDGDSRTDDVGAVRERACGLGRDARRHRDVAEPFGQLLQHRGHRPDHGRLLGLLRLDLSRVRAHQWLVRGLPAPHLGWQRQLLGERLARKLNQQSCLLYSPAPTAPFDAPAGHHDIAVPANDWGFVRIHALGPSGVTIASIQVSGVGGTGAYGSFSAWSTGPQAGDSVTFRVPVGDLSFVSGIQVTDTAQDQLTVPYVDLTGFSVQPGQTTTIDAQTWSSVTGTIRWPNAFSAKSCKIFYGSCQLAPDGWSATYSLIFDPNDFSDSILVAFHIGTCATDPFSCADQGGSRLGFTVGNAPVVPGGTSHFDGVLDPSFQFGQICGKITA